MHVQAHPYIPFCAYILSFWIQNSALEIILQWTWIIPWYQKLLVEEAVKFHRNWTPALGEHWKRWKHVGSEILQSSPMYLHSLQWLNISKCQVGMILHLWTEGNYVITHSLHRQVRNYNHLFKILKGGPAELAQGFVSVSSKWKLGNFRDDTRQKHFSLLTSQQLEVDIHSLYTSDG